MIIKTAFGRCLICVLVTSYVWASVAPDGALAQTAECNYDRKAPSLKSARGSFQEFDFACAERELTDLLKAPNLDAGVQADAHALLAAIYFQTLPDNKSRREKVIEEFRRTYSLRPEWNGRPDIQTPAFRDLMTEAKRQVDQLRQKDKPAPPPTTTAPKPTPAVTAESKPASKGGSKKTWVYVAIGAAAAGVAVIALGGGGGGSNGGSNLPNFPPPPAGTNR